ncbi:shugoshin-1-like [Triticum dicoccoides]|uniref:shugoshin-1-like n=1 Tax=Triticum dicoccoides TaxID=85692 RepID=UPI00188DE85D|nr:shugoshin-1-like [Triticum dicoccoides]
METAVLAPQQANPAQAAVAQTRNAATMAAMRKLGAAGATSARRKTLCDITNLRRPLAAAAADELQQDGSRCTDGVDGIARLIKENSDLVKLLEERDKVIELSGAEVQNLRLANWQLAQANSQMLAELNLGKNRLKLLQHELTCSRAALRVKSSELEEAKKALKSSRLQQQKSANETARHLVADRAAAAAAQLKDGDAEPASDASRAASAKKSTCNASRKRLLRSRSLGPAVAPTKLVAASKERESAQRRKSMRTPQPSGRREDLFETEDVQLTAGGGDDRKETSWELDSSVQFPRRSSLGRPLRRATEKVTSYKEMPVNIKLRRP